MKKNDQIKTGIATSAAIGATGKPPTVPSAIPPDDPLSFAPVPGESVRAFEAFRAYLELGPRRRYLAVGRKVGASLSTVKRWATDFDWRGRIKSFTASGAAQSARIELAVQHDELLAAAARAKTFRDRQYALADAILDVAERYLERVEDVDLDQMRFTDACKALDFASRIARQTRDSDATPDHGLRDQLTALLDQACGKTPSPPAAANPVKN